MIDVTQTGIKCCGCGVCEISCVKKAITLKTDKEGFRYPAIDYSNCVKCGKCLQVCPIMNLEDVTLQEDESFWAAYDSNDDSDRLSSSSGGVFGVLCSEVLDAGGIVFGVAMSENGRSAKFVSAENTKQLMRIKGSKYIQSETTHVFECVKKELLAKRRVLFSGTPCQVAALKSYLKKDNELLLTVDVICHGVPSPRVWNSYVDYIEKNKKSTVSEVLFRDKTYGWENYGIRITFKNGSEYYKSKDVDPFLLSFNNDLLLRPSCYFCKFKGKKHVSDITLGDFWGVDDYNSKLNDHKGISSVICHTPKGNMAFQKIVDKLSSIKISENECLKNNHSYYKSAYVHSKREEFLDAVLNKGNFKRVVYSFCGIDFLHAIKREIAFRRRAKAIERKK